MIRWIPLLLLQIACVVFSPLAQAQPLGGVVRATCSQAFNGAVIAQTGGNFPLGAASCSLGSSSGSVAIQPVVLLTAFADAGTVAPGNGSGINIVVNLQYDFTVTGGVPGDLVPVIIRSSMRATASPSDDASNANGTAASLNIYGLSAAGTVNETGPSASTCAFSPQINNCTGQYDGDLSFAMRSGAAGRVFLQLLVGASSNSAGTASGWIDPYIFVDPLFAGAANYSITVADGVANVPVPEPAAASMLLVGVAALLLLGRRRQRTHARGGQCAHSL